MKNKFLLRSFWVALFALFFTGVFAQAPEYTVQLRNAVQVSTKILEVEIWLASTNPVIPFEYGSGNYGIYINPAIKNTGALSCTLVSGSSQFAVTSQIPTSINIHSQTAPHFKIAPKTPPGAGGGQILPSGAGLRLVTVRLVNTTDFTPGVSPNFAFIFASPYPCIMNAYYDPGTGTVTNNVCTNQSYYSNQTGNLPLNPPAGPTPYALTLGTTPICQGQSTLVTLVNSQTTYTYELYKDGLATGFTQPGVDGMPLVWPVTDAGTYTVMSGTTAMLNPVVLVVNPANTYPTVITQCGGSFFWPVNSETYTGSTTQSITIGCDTYTLDLTINTMQFAAPEVVVQCGGTYTWHGTVYDATGTYTWVDNCTTYTLDLTINAMQFAAPEVVVQCGGTYTWHGTVYDATGTYTWVDNCVTYTLDLTINPMQFAAPEVVVQCGGTYTWHGTVYDVTGTYTWVDNCTTYTLDLTINTMQFAAPEVVVQCGGTYTWHGTVYDATGTYTWVDNCVTYTLDLTINTMQFAAPEVVVQCGGTYTWHGTVYDATGTYTWVDNCVTYTLDLTINAMQFAAPEVVVQCGGTYTWHGTVYDATGTYTWVDNCVTYTLDLTINTMQFAAPEVVVQCGGTYTWHGTVYDVTGTYTWVDNCTTYTLDLTINTMQFAAPEVVNICSGTYTWHGTVYDMSGVYTWVDNCVTYTLDLTIGGAITQEYTESACVSYTWALNGMTYTASGDYTWVDGCVTHILHLTIQPMTFVPTQTEVICGGSYLWLVNGQTYNVGGVYTYVDGCMTYTLDLTISPVVISLINPTVLVNSGATSELLLYNTISGSPDQYSIQYNAAALAAGFVNVVNQPLVPGQILIPIPGGATAVYYYADLIVSNSVTGCVSNVYPIVVKIPVQNPNTFTVSKDIGTTITIGWTAVPDAYRYRFDYRAPGGTWMGTSTFGTSLKISNLTPGTTYECRVITYKWNGMSAYYFSTSQIGTFTPQAVMFGKTFDIGTTCLISWPDYSFWASNYAFQYKKQGTSLWYGSVRYLPEAKLTNLEPETAYDVRVVVYTSGGLYGTTSQGTFTTGKVNYTYTLGTTTADISWLNTETPDMTTWATTPYAFQYREVGGSWIGANAFTNSYSLTGLTPGMNYECRVYVYKAGSGWGITQTGTFTTSTAKSFASDNDNVTVYPNPFVDQVNMTMFNEDLAKVTWNIYDMTGKVVMSGSESLSSGYSTLNIDAANLSKGVYMLNAIVNDKMESFRIMKQ